jgi:hypothetical protein
MGDQDSADESSTQPRPDEGYGRNESPQPGSGDGGDSGEEGSESE